MPPTNLTSDENNTSWTAFKADANDDDGLEWEFSDLSLSSTFLDMNITIQPDGKLETVLYEKPMALYLFIPPHSAHPPGVLTSHVYGNILRIFRLNSNEKDVIQDSVTFFRRFLERGHNCDILKPLFLKAITNARKFLNTSNEARATLKLQQAEEARRRLYLHIEYHPQNPPPHQIQQIFNDTMLNPPGKMKLNELDAGLGELVPIDAMIIANHRAKNLGDMLSYRDISNRNGPPASSYL